MLDPGYYPLRLEGTLSDGTTFAFSQAVYVRDGNYPYDPPLVVNSETIDVENTTPEDLQWSEVVSPITPQRYWQGQFGSPVPDYYSDCYPSLFGNRRSYNGSAYDFFHTGLDFCGQIGTEIYAPENGVVVFTDSTIVRGNATVIDHGWGVYTAYAHQSEILVRNVKIFLKPQGFAIIAIKSRSIDVTEKPKIIYKKQRKILEKFFHVTDFVKLDPYEKDHGFFVLKRKV